MLGDLRVDHFLAMNLEIVKRTLFIARHEAAVAGNITSQYRGKSALDAIVTHAELTWSPNRKSEYIPGIDSGSGFHSHGQTALRHRATCLLSLASGPAQPESLLPTAPG